MNYTFPIIETIDDVLPHIKNYEEIVVSENVQGNYVTIRYMISTPQLWEWNDDDALGCAIRRECRGIAFSTKTGEILSRPWHKFFNVNEKPETQLNIINLEEPHLILEKLDGCLYGGEVIHFCDGTSHTISEIVSNKLIGPIWGFDEDTKTVVPTMILNWANYGYSDLKNWRKITTTARDRNRNITVTINHKIMTQTGWVEVKDLSVGDTMFLNVDSLNSVQKSMILGSLLGDSSLIINNGISFSCGHSNKQKEYIDLKKKILTPFYTYTDIVESGYGSLMHRIRFSNTECLEPIVECTYSGKKIVTEFWLNNLDPISLAFWYMDDGSISYGNKESQRPRAMLHVSGFDSESKNNIINYFNKVYGISPVLQKDQRGYIDIRFNADDAVKFWGIIAPYMHKSMEYKIPENMRLTQYYWDNYLFDSEPSKSMRKIVISNIENKISWTDYKKTVKYDIETSTNNFFVNSMLVHNSMIRPIKCPDGDFYIATKAGESEVSAQASNWLKDLWSSNYYDFMNYMIGNQKSTPIFEWCSRQNRIVIDYPEDRLVLTAIRSNHTGKYFKYDDMKYYGSLYGIDVVDVVHMTEGNIGPLVDNIKKWTDAEGIVIRFDTGHMLKIKADDYILRHYAKESINHEKNLIGLILADGLDDLLPVLHENDQKRVSDFEKAFHASIHDTAMNIHDMYGEYVRNYALSDKKDFAVNFALKKEKKYQQFLFGLHRGNYNLLDALYKAIENSISSSSRVENVRWIFGGIRF